jgi:hypothetical protein
MTLLVLHLVCTEVANVMELSNDIGVSIQECVNGLGAWWAVYRVIRAAALLHLVACLMDSMVGRYEDA